MNPRFADYEHLTRGAGYVALGDWSAISVRGADRAVLVNNLCTAAVARLQPGEGCEAFFTDVKGHVLGHAIILCRAEELLMWTAPGQTRQLVAHIERYVIREDVELHDQSGDVRLVVVAGPSSPRAIGEQLFALLDRPLAHRAMDETAAVVARCPWFGPSAVVCQCAAESIDELMGTLDRNGAIACDATALDSLRIECGTPYYGVDFDASNLPQEVNRNDVAISFTKGCYLGQETVARIDALGHVNRLLVRVRFVGDNVPPAGTVLLAGEKEVGKVTSAAWSPRLGSPLALAMVRRGHHEPGTTLDSAAGTAIVLGG
jgi:folate-binding protein YgfZ